jgi:hypothetical protein
MRGQPPTRCRTNLERALARGGYDTAFRLQVQEDGTAVRAAYRLAGIEWRLLADVVADREPDPATDPTAATGRG